MRKYLFPVLILILIGCQDRKTTQIEYWKPNTSFDSLGQIEMEEDTSKWRELKNIPDRIIIDLVYASEDNFIGRPLYQCERCFLNSGTFKSLLLLSDSLFQHGYQLKILDCYRPRRVQQILYEALPESFFFRDPKQGAWPTRGVTVDMTLCDLAGNELDMGSRYNTFDSTSFHTYSQLEMDIKNRRSLLSSVARHFGFQAMAKKWWQYNDRHHSGISSDVVWLCDEGG